MVMLWRTNFCRSANCAGAYVNCISAALVNHWKHKLHTEHRLTLLVAVVLCSKLIQDWCGRFKPFGYYTHIFIPSWNGAPLKKKVGMEHIIFLVFRIFRLDYYMLLEIWSCLNKHTFTCDLCVCDDLFDLVCLMSALIYFKVETANATSDTWISKWKYIINVTISILTDTSFLFIVDCFIDKKLPKMCILKFYARSSSC